MRARAEESENVAGPRLTQWSRFRAHADTHIYHMPIRKTDKASVLRKAQITYKLNVSPTETVVHLKR